MMNNLIKIILIVNVFLLNNVWGQDEKFFKALAIVESNNNPLAYGKKRNEIGIYQIRDLYFIDALSYNKQKNNKYGLNNLSHKDCFNAEISKRVVKAYLDCYASKNKTIERMARIHNGGPKYPIKKTNGYWIKFSKIYNSIK